MNTSQVINDSGIEFGTSGARGLVVDFNIINTAAFTLAFLNHIKNKYKFESVGIAIDNRPSSYGIAQFCAAAVEYLGLTPVFYGVVPTPALANQCMADNIPAIMVTGSHIPFDRNGLKFYTPEGEIDKCDELSILNAGFDFEFSSMTLPSLNVCHSAAQQYISRYTTLLSDDFLSGMHIGIYEHSSAGREIYPVLFRALGATVTSFGRSDEFVPIDTEAVSSEDCSKALVWSQHYKLDAIFSTDGDGDRPLIADENGVWLRGDILGLLSAVELDIKALSVPVSCNTIIETVGFFDQVCRTRIGSPHVIQAFSGLKQKFDKVAGFEANGGFLLGSDVAYGDGILTALPTRDAVLPAIMLFSAAKQSSISTLVKALPARYTCSDRIQNFAKNKSAALLESIKSDPSAFILSSGLDGAVKTINETDGLRMSLSNDNIIHLRPSGNAPELRCYVEAHSSEEAHKVVDIIINYLKDL